VPGVAEGFGYLASPLEIVQSYGAIANGGRLMKPAQADAIGGQMIRRVVSEEIAAKTRELLRQVVLTGTAKKAQSKLYSTAGKTASAARSGTIEWNGSGDQKSDFAGFVGFAPVDHPQVEVYVGIFDPKTASGDGAHGGEHAAPVFKRIAEDVLRQWNVAPDMN
jgi:cell division protein FtsI/penicillin-binding protein 2